MTRRRSTGAARDGLRLAVGTLTRIPVRAPSRVDHATAAVAMSVAPLVGLLLSAIIGVPMVLVDRLLGSDAAGGLASLVIAALAITALAWLTRAIHLDGLADTADALGSGKPAQQALAIARRSDIGPFGVLSIVLLLLLQVTSLAVAIEAGSGVAALISMAVVGRLGLTIACLRGIPAARPDGLGAAVAGTVPRAVGLLLIGIVLAVTLLWPGSLDGHGIARGCGVIGGGLAALLVVRIAIRRLGGITGDVLGAVVECSATTALVIFALLSA
jgi:adenosylcobinamide-GDP ribazoletransferase